MYVPTVPAIAFACFFVYLCYHQYQVYRKLRQIPGPFWAKFTNLQRVKWVLTKHSQLLHQKVHDEYGDFVRIGPNMVTISDPAAIPSIYPIRPGFPKGDFYKTLMPYTRKGAALPLVFNTRDENLHKQLKTPIAPIFSLSNVLTFERFVDEVMSIFFIQLDNRYARTKVRSAFDLGDWLQYFAFEVMGTMTFSRRYGFLENGNDDNGMIGAIWNFMETAAPVTQIPWVDKLLYKNPVVARFRSTTGMPILKIVLENIEERRRKVETNGGVQNIEEINNGDMLSRFLDVQLNNKTVPPWAVTAWTFSNIIAGSDSTAVVMRTLWYNLLAHPASSRNLYEELLDAERKDELSRPFPQWNEIRNLPYLDCCVNEAIRLHPPFCLPFERVVPKGGVTILGKFFPEGTAIGINPYVVNRHRPTFGEDADSWRPERWLGDDEHHRKLEGSVLTFGAGRRICLGKNIAILELKKLTAALLLNYQLQLVDRKQYTVENSWFFRQHGLNVNIEKRRDL